MVYVSRDTGRSCHTSKKNCRTVLVYKRVCWKKESLMDGVESTGRRLLEKVIRTVKLERND